MQCPDCGGPMWDNRQTKRKPTQPDYKCKDKDNCGKGVWLQPKGSGGSGNGAASGPGAVAASRSTASLSVVYADAMEIASRAVKHYCPNATPADVIAATATIFIQSAQTGRPIKKVAAPARPAAPPPPPPPPEEDDYPEADDLPF